MLNTQEIKARDLSDAWFQTLFRILDEGTVFTIDRGSYAGQKRLEFDWITIHIKYPGTRPLLPQIESHYNIPNPVSDDYLDDYLPYLMTGVKKPGESYTYGQRITKHNIPYPIENAKEFPWTDILISEVNDFVNVANNFKSSTVGEFKIREYNNDEPILFDEEYFLNQIELMIWTYKNKGFRNNQMILQVAEPTDMLLQDPPCLRHIDTRIQDGKLHFYPYFRSWDLYGGFPANLGGIQLLKEYCAEAIGVEDGEIIATSKGLHIYDYTFDLAKILRMREDMILKGE